MRRARHDPVLEAAAARAGAGRQAVLATIAATRGSTPRIAGTRMLVDAEGIVGSVGGGQLEYEIIAAARDMLRLAERQPRRRHFILGPDLGQCCGGALDIVLEPLLSSDLGWLAEVNAWNAAGISWLGALAIGAPAPSREVWRQGEAPAGISAAVHPGAARLVSIGGAEMLVEATAPVAPPVLVFGAGHVGSALVRLLGDLSRETCWVDARPGIFPQALPANVTALASADVAGIVAAAPPQAHFLVMTHSHALDFEVVAEVLKRDDFASLGLIGSATKRARFLQRLRERHTPEPLLARLECPVGLPGIRSKVPAAIAIGIVAGLLLQDGAGAAGLEPAGMQMRA